MKTKQLGTQTEHLENNAPPFEPSACRHRHRLTLVGQQVRIACDHAGVMEICQKAFKSRYFAAQSTPVEIEFFCSLNCAGPWSVAFASPDALLVGRRTGAHPPAYEFFKGTPPDPEAFWSFQYDNLTSSDETSIAIYAALFQHWLTGILIRRLPTVRLIHSAILAHRGEALMFLAPKMGGKSTISVAGIHRGLQFLTEDFTVIDISSGQISPFPKPIRLREGTCRMLPFLNPLLTQRQVDISGENRFLLYPEKINADLRFEAVPLKTIFTLKGFAPEPVIAPADPLATATTLTISDFINPKESFTEMVWQWSAITNRVPCFELTAGEPLETIDAVIAAVEQE